MKWDIASKRQLLQIALHEDCDLNDKYAAARELQINQWSDDMIPDLILLYGRGHSLLSIAVELGIEQYMVQNKINEYGLKRRSGS
ncbi:hypothetical protein [Rossellomorea aquimaris]|jgi:hypothetical protein|uniref:hypothetical protein n=1 Tax=Rossellomorea aquimaris TaxID=189382 RepID=UPI0011E94B53|nr:hypothetical protein [Rossellomorea aquimaris]TYS91917.1 hypothetical protein FZC88_07220 [Rossellomorea aquimaris]